MNMEGNLIIVESPAKAKTIQKFLGKDFIVKSSFGHIRDLPKESGAIRIVEKGPGAWDFVPTYVVSDGTGNCPYQKSLARFSSRKCEIARELRAKGVATKEANRRAEKLAGEGVKVWHCRNCSERGTGCCGSGDIRFNVVGERDWAVKAEQRKLNCGSARRIFDIIAVKEGE